MTRTLAVCDLSDWRAGGERREHFVAQMGAALQDIGFFALTGLGPGMAFYMAIIGGVFSIGSGVCELKS